MPLFGKSRAPERAEHPLVMTKRAAAATRGVYKREKMKAKDSFLLVGYDEQDDLLTTVTDKQNHWENPNLVFAETEGIVLSVPRHFAFLFTGYSLDLVRNEFALMGTYNDRQTAASRPGYFEMSPLAYKELAEAAGQRASLLNRMASTRHLFMGNTAPAVVMSADPFVVAAYSYEFDAVALVNLPRLYVRRHKIKPGTKLLNVNGYLRDTEPMTDIVPGPKDRRHWRSFQPVIADFLTEDHERVRAIKNTIPAEEWKRCYQQGKEAMVRAKGRYREGCPPFTEKSAY